MHARILRKQVTGSSASSHWLIESKADAKPWKRNIAWCAPYSSDRTSPESPNINKAKCRNTLLDSLGRELCYHWLSSQIDICDHYLDAADRDVADDPVGVFVIRQSLNEIQYLYDPPNGLEVTRTNAMDSLYVPALRDAILSLESDNEFKMLNRLIQVLSI